MTNSPSQSMNDQTSRACRNMKEKIPCERKNKISEKDSPHCIKSTDLLLPFHIESAALIILIHLTVY